jgi:hypothetical protein
MHGNGYGSTILKQMKEKETCLAGWVIDGTNYIKADGQPYHSPLGFYLKNQFSILKDSRLETEKISAVKIIWNR